MSGVSSLGNPPRYRRIPSCRKVAALNRRLLPVLVVLYGFLLLNLAGSKCGAEAAGQYVTTNEELVSAIKSAKPLQAEWTDGTETKPIVADFDGDGHRTDTVRTWAVHGGAPEADGQAGVVIAVLNVTEELGNSKVMWTDGYVTTIKRDEDGPVDGLVPIVDIADKTDDGRDDLLLRWTDQSGTLIDTEVYSWQAKGMKCIEGCD